MKTLRIAQAALATILAVGINSTTHAFMAVPVDQPAEVQMSLTEMVDSFRTEIAAGETSCEDMLAKLDAALEQMDAKLDTGVPNEEEYLAAREAISKMRYDLECLGQKLTQFGNDPGGPIPGMPFPGGPIPGMPIPGGPLGGGTPNAAFTIGNSGGGTSGLEGLGTMAIIGGAVVGVADDSRNFGITASESVAN